MNAPVTLTEPGRRPVATKAPSQTTGRHEFPNAGHEARIARRARAVPVSTRRARSSLTSAVPSSRALATAGASASAFSSEVA